MEARSPADSNLVELDEFIDKLSQKQSIFTLLSASVLRLRCFTPEIHAEALQKPTFNGKKGGLWGARSRKSILRVAATGPAQALGAEILGAGSSVSCSSATPRSSEGS